MNTKLQQVYDKCMQAIKESNLSRVEECIVANFIMNNWLFDSLRVKQIIAISEIYEFVFNKGNLWPKFMKKIIKCEINVFDNEDISLDLSFLWEGEIYLLSYNPYDERYLDTFYIESDVQFEKESNEEQNQVFDEIIEFLDNVAEEINAQNDGDLFIYKVEHKDSQVACRKLLDELEKVLD